jgi:DNA-binding NtrC family response regulator
MTKILIADDERAICDAFSRLIEMEGHQPLVASNGKQALQRIEDESPAAVFLDVRMPGMDGLETLARIRAKQEDLPVVIMTAHGDMETAMQAVKLQAFDYLGKPVELAKVRELIRQMLQQRNVPPGPQPEPGDADSEPQLVGKSPVMQELFKLMGLLTGNDMTVLITGESGVGKELVARGIHRHSSRAEQPFVAINCAAIPEHLLESELFGHEKGAFTGADGRHIGRFESVGNGTLLLDEIGELPLSLQSKLLRVLQERSFEPVGGSQAIPLRARLLTATNRDLSREADSGQFRADLYHRLNLVHLPVPPLREREGDIELLAHHFISQVCRELKRPLLSLDPEVVGRLERHPWPGNVRELEHLIKRSVLTCRGHRLTLDELKLSDEAEAARQTENGVPPELEQTLRQALRSMLKNRPASDESPFHRLITLSEQILIDEALHLSAQNQVSASKLLGLHRTTLRKKMKQPDV